MGELALITFVYSRILAGTMNQLGEASGSGHKGEHQDFISYPWLRRPAGR